MQMKATEQYFPVVLIIMPSNVVITFEAMDEIVKCAIQMKATEEYLSMVLFVFRYFTKRDFDFFLRVK